MAAERICLTVTSFEANIQNSFQLMLKERSHCDVTLASEDGHTVDVHRVILVAGSEFFSAFLKEAKSSALYFYLKGIKSKELDNIVDFLYRGETNLAQEDLYKFLVAARELKVRGLDESLPADSESRTEETNSEFAVSIKDSESEDKILPNRGKMILKDEKISVEQTYSSEETDSESLIETFPDITSNNRKTVERSYEIIQEDDERRMDQILCKLGQMTQKTEDGQWACGVCGKMGKFWKNRSGPYRSCAALLAI